jgi:dihydropteroate synthase
MTTSHDPFVLDCRGKILDCRPGRASGAAIMGILNVTPDSFSDGGRFMRTDAALAQAEAMLQAGAAVIDVGGESTRPRGAAYGVGAGVVTEEEERERILPVVRAIASRFPEAIVSIDTYKPAVAAAALEAGAAMVNDVTGLRLYPETAAVAAEAGAPLVLMHALGRPGDMPHEHRYGDVVAEVLASLERSVAVAEEAGVRHTVIDPGFGFGKTPEENATLIRRLDALRVIDRPILIGVSRKRSTAVFMGDPDLPPEARLPGSLAATATAVLRGATLVRTHDVPETAAFLRALAWVGSGH